MEIIRNYFMNLSDLFIEMAFYVVIGLVFTGILHVLVKKEWVTKQVGKRGVGSVVKASLIGVPLPLCSCGVVPTAIQLGKSGASKGAVTSFLTSTPQTGVDSIIATYGMMGPLFAIYRAVAAFVSGIVTGTMTDLLVKDEKIAESTHSCGCGCGGEKETPHEEDTSCGCGCGHHHEVKSTRKQSKVEQVFRYAFGEFLDEIAGHFIIGLLIAAGITTIIPENFFLGFTSPFITMLIMLIVGIPMYVCSTSSIPIAVSFILSGISPGAAFVFLFTGPVTNAASLVMLVKSLGKKTVSIYIASVAVCAIAFGILLDVVVQFVDQQGFVAMQMEGGHGDAWYMQGVAILFFVSLMLSIAKSIKGKVEKIHSESFQVHDK